MQPRSIVGLFCEDIRAEKSGAFTLVGVMPDNANLPEPPTPDKRGMISKLCVYVRANFDIAEEIKKVSLFMCLPDGQEIALGEAGPKVIAHAFESSKKKDSPLATIMLRAELQAFPVVSLGRILIEVDVDGDRSIAAQLNLTHEPDEGAQSFEETFTRHVAIKTISSTEKLPPS